MSTAYGLDPDDFENLLQTEYPSLHSSELVYLDHAAAQLPPISALTSFTDALSSTLYSNPHTHPATHRDVDKMRSRVMRTLFALSDSDLDGWDLVWTSGATASLKLVAENFPWGPHATYRYIKESHTSLVGVRGCALAAAARVESLDLDAFLTPQLESRGPVLHAYPAQCNVTGARLGIHPALSLSRSLKSEDNRHAVLIDAAAYLSTSVLDLSNISYEEAPDFIAGSFYKIYGHPTGLGFLLVKRSSAHFLTTVVSSSFQDSYFGGGSIDALSVSAPYWVYPKRSKPSELPGVVHERFERGTIAFLSVIALGSAMDAHEKLFTPKRRNNNNPDPTASLRAVRDHTHHLANLAHKSLETLNHWDGTPLVRIYRGEGSEKWEHDGSIIAFTLQTPSSSSTEYENRGRKSGLVGHVHIANLATLANIQLRTGGMCNVAVMARVGRLSDTELKELWYEGRVCGDAQEFGGSTGDKPLGLVRISFGACSSEEDVRKLVSFLKRYFLVSTEVADMSQWIDKADKRRQNTEINGLRLDDTQSQTTGAYISSIVRYPIKSCGGQQLETCTLTPTGLLHDREFALIDTATGKQMSQKRFPSMVLIRPTVLLEGKAEVLRVTAPKMKELTVKMEEGISNINDQQNTAATYRVSVEADEWFTKFLGVTCQLHRFSLPAHMHTPFVPLPSSCAMNSFSHDSIHVPTHVPILFSNESPFTLISASSVQAVNDWIKADNSEKHEEAMAVQEICFRANFTLSHKTGLSAFHEDGLSHIRIGDHIFQVLAPCRRCLMICVDPDRGIKLKEPFNTLAKRRRNGRQRVEFGVHLLWRKDLDWGREASLEVGDTVSWTVADANG